MNRRIDSSGATLFEFERSSIEKYLSDQISSITGIFSRKVVNNFEGSGWRIDDIAQKFGVSVRGLQRRLLAENNGFRWLRDLYRYKRSVELLTLGASTQFLADALGFTDRVSFEAACRRWCGLTPAQLRIALSKSSDQNCFTEIYKG